MAGNYNSAGKEFGFASSIAAGIHSLARATARAC